MKRILIIDRLVVIAVHLLILGFLMIGILRKNWVIAALVVIP